MHCVVGSLTEGKRRTNVMVFNNDMKKKQQLWSEAEGGWEADVKDEVCKKNKRKILELHSYCCLCVCVSVSVTLEGLPRSCVYTRWLAFLCLPVATAHRCLSDSKAALCCIADPAALWRRWANIVVWQKGLRNGMGMMGQKWAGWYNTSTVRWSEA